MAPILRAGLPGAAALAALALAALPAQAATTVCKGVGRSEAGLAVAEMQMVDGNPGDTSILFVPSLSSMPAHGAAAPGDVLVQLDLKYSFNDPPAFEGLGIEITFPGNVIKTPIDVTAMVGEASVTRKGMTPNADGHYTARLGAGPAKGNALVAAIDDNAAVHVVITAAGAPDQALVNANIGIGLPAQRQALGNAALDDLEKKAKAGC